MEKRRTPRRGLQTSRVKSPPRLRGSAWRTSPKTSTHSFGQRVPYVDLKALKLP
jgi:hypothetical protein